VHHAFLGFGIVTMLSTVVDGMLSSTPHQRLNGFVFKRFAEKTSSLQVQ